MPAEIEHKGHKLDDIAQKILVALYEGQTLTTSELREWTEAKNNQIVKYRIDEHLRPAGLVVKNGEKKVRNGAHPSYVWKLSYPDGREWVDAHLEELEEPKTFEEVHEIAQSAHEAAQTAMDRVQDMEGGRGYVEKVRQELEGYLDDLADLEDMVETAENAAENARAAYNQTQENQRDAAQAADDARRQADLIGGEIDSLRRDIDELESEHEDRADRLAERIEEVEDRQRDLGEFVEDLEARQQQISDQLDNVQTAVDKPWWRVW